MISITIIQRVPCDSEFVVIFFKTIYNKAIIRLGFCDILNSQGLGSVLSASAFGSAYNTSYLDLDYSGYHKTFIQ